MADYCPQCGNMSLMFANISSIFGIEPWCQVCDPREMDQHGHWPLKEEE